ncbi:MAG: UMP kinase [Lachnospiraceae bacterium]|nr:UMP kinase [Lachnospiraceae bacterium]MBR6270557.1 UMP kinase [Lachnospiraceae bacterium]
MDKKRRVLLKLSGEALGKKDHSGFDDEVIKDIGLQIKRAMDEGVQIGIVIGGGNFWRGRQSNSVERVKADQIGMLATAMNCLYVSSFFNTLGIETAVFCSFEIAGAIPVFNYDDVLKALDEGKAVFFAGGTGHPYFSTDTGVVLRAIEMHADEILMAKNIDGVYDSSPSLNPNAKKFDVITIEEMLEKRLQVIDVTASALCCDNRIPMAIFKLGEPDSVYNAMKGNITGTRITV